MRLALFIKLILVSLSISLLCFALLNYGLVETLRLFAFGIVASIAITAIYPEVRGVRAGDYISVVSDSSIPSIMGRSGKAEANGRKNEKIKIMLDNGSEVMGVIESYTGLISAARVRTIYEERLVD